MQWRDCLVAGTPGIGTGSVLAAATATPMAAAGRDVFRQMISEPSVFVWTSWIGREAQTPVSCAEPASTQTIFATKHMQVHLLCRMIPAIPGVVRMADTDVCCLHLINMTFQLRKSHATMAGTRLTPYVHRSALDPGVWLGLD